MNINTHSTNARQEMAASVSQAVPASVSQVVAAYAYLCPRGFTLNFDRFAQRVSAVSPEAGELLGKTQGKIRRGLFGAHSAGWEV